MNTELTRKDIVDYINEVEFRCASEVIECEDDLPSANKVSLQQLICPMYFNQAYLGRLEWLKQTQHFTATAIADGCYYDIYDIEPMETDFELALSVNRTDRYFDQKVFATKTSVALDDFTLQKIDKSEISQCLVSSPFIDKLKYILTQPQFDMCANKYFSAKYSEWQNAKHRFLDKNSPLNIEYNFAVLMFYYGVAKALLDYSNDYFGKAINITQLQDVNEKLQNSILALDTHDIIKLGVTESAKLQELKLEQEIISSWLKLVKRKPVPTKNKLSSSKKEKSNLKEDEVKQANQSLNEDSAPNTPNTILSLASNRAILRLIHALHMGAGVSVHGVKDIIWHLASLFGVSEHYNTSNIKSKVKSLSDWYNTDAVRIYTGRLTILEEKYIKDYESPYKDHWGWSDLDQ